MDHRGEGGGLKGAEKGSHNCLMLPNIYICYQIALEMFRLASLNKHRQERCLDFSLKFSKHPTNNILFPRNLNSNNHAEEFLVNSAIPYCQPILNEHFAAKS